MTYDLGCAKGCVYKIICKTDCDIVYIGSTFNKPSKRWNEHKNSYYSWIKDPTKRGFSIYPYFQSIGIENFKLIKIKDYEVIRADRLDRKHLLVYEQLWINKTKCVNKQAAFGLWKFFEKDKKKLYYQDNKEQISEKKKIYYKDNKDQIKEQKKIYHEKNKEQINEKKKIYREKNKEQISEKHKIYCEKNKEHIKEQSKKHYRDNKEQINEKRKKHNQDNKVICPICLKEVGKYYLKKHTANKHP